METFTKQDWQEFLNKRVAVNCKTEELAIEFLEYDKIKELRLKERSCMDLSHWNMYKGNTGYSTHYGFGYSEFRWHIEQGLTVKEFKGWDEFNFNAEEFKQRFIELRQAMQQRVVDLKRKDWVDRVQKFTSLMIELRNPELTKEQKYDIEAEICMMFMVENK